VILRNLLVMQVSAASKGGAISSGPSGGADSVQLRLTDSQTQKLEFVMNNGDFHLVLRPPNSSLDSANTYQDSHILLFDGPGRRIP
jgi:hypothetical protein